MKGDGEEEGDSDGSLVGAGCARAEREGEEHGLQAGIEQGATREGRSGAQGRRKERWQSVKSGLGRLTLKSARAF